MGRDNAKRKKAFFFLIKLGVGWVIGMLLAVSVLANVFGKRHLQGKLAVSGLYHSGDTGHDNGRKREHVRANITTSYGLLSALLSLWAFPL